MNIRHKQVKDIYLNISHFLDHFVMLIFAKAAYDAGNEFGLGYDEIIVFGFLGFVLFGGMAPIAAILADKFSRTALMVVFHFGIGIAAILAGFSGSAWELSLSIGLIGVFAAIYHPVGIAMLIKSNKKIGFRLGVNGVFGNMGVAAAPLITGILLIFFDWRMCFILPGILCIIYGFIFISALTEETKPNPKIKAQANDQTNDQKFAPQWQRALLALGLTTASGGFIFGAMTFIVPRYFEIQLSNLSTSVAITGLFASIVFAFAAFSQIGIGWLIDRYSAKLILFFLGLGQIIFIFLAAKVTNLSLVFVTLGAMSFVFGQIPIIDTILSRYIPDEWRPKVLSIKFIINFGIGASVLPASGFLLQSGYQLSSLFILMSFMATLIVVASVILPNQDITKSAQQG